MLRYSDADFPAVSRALETDTASRPVTVEAPPTWLLPDVNLGRFRHGSDHLFEKAVATGRPFAPDHIRTASRWPCPTTTS